MKWLENIRKKPRDEKIKLIWIIVVIVIVVLIAIWVFAGKYNAQKGNSEIFKSIGDILQNTKETVPDLKTDNN